MLIAGAMVFNYVVTVENIPHSPQRLPAGPRALATGYLILVNLLLLVLGCLLEGTTILLVIVPVLIPTAEALGIDLVHFGVVVVVNIMLGLITPPYGLLLFIMTNISGAPLAPSSATRCPSSSPCWSCWRSSPSCPATVLWLPRLLGYQG